MGSKGVCYMLTMKVTCEIKISTTGTDSHTVATIVIETNFAAPLPYAFQLK